MLETMSTINIFGNVLLLKLQKKKKKTLAKLFWLSYLRCLG